MTVMAILQDVDKCMRCNGCVTACKRTWNLKPPATIAEVKPARALVGPRQRMAIKSVRRGDMGPFIRYGCWHCPNPPCAYYCPFGAINKQESGAVSVDNAKCDPTACEDPMRPGVKPCEIGCQRGGYPKVPRRAEDYPYASGPYMGLPKMNKCTLCHGRAGSDAQITAAGGNPLDGLQTRATAAEIALVPERAHEPACVSTCPAKAMKWDTQANILAYLQDPANGYILANGTRNWYGNGSLFWASKKTLLIPPKADPLVEDHLAPMAANLLSSGRMVVPTLVIGGLAALAARKAKVSSEAATSTGEV